MKHRVEWSVSEGRAQDFLFFDSFRVENILNKNKLTVFWRLFHHTYIENNVELNALRERLTGHIRGV